MLLYFIIFISKVIENALATLRIIVVSNGKKGLGALLQGIIAVVWILVTGIVVVDIMKDPLKIVFFALGSLVGSYIGSYIEEKIALGSNMLTVVVHKNKEKLIINYIKKKGFNITSIDGKDKDKTILFIMIKRKEKINVINEIKKLDNKSLIMVEKAYIENRTN